MKYCKWCGKVTLSSDEQCGKCWGFTHELNRALHVPKLFQLLERLVKARKIEMVQEKKEGLKC